MSLFLKDVTSLPLQGVERVLKTHLIPSFLNELATCKRMHRCISTLVTKCRLPEDGLTVLVLAVGADRLGQQAAAPRARWVQGRTLAPTASGTGSASDVARSQAACADEDTCLTFFSRVQQSSATTAYILGAFTSAHLDWTPVACCAESVWFGEVWMCNSGNLKTSPSLRQVHQMHQWFPNYWCTKSSNTHNTSVSSDMKSHRWIIEILMIQYNIYCIIQ